MSEIRLESDVSAAPKDVFSCWTTNALIRSWLCENAILNTQEGGAFALTGVKGVWAAGTYNSVEVDRRLVFSWQDGGAPGATQIEVSFEDHPGGTHLTFCHSGFGSGDRWDAYRAERETQWKDLLENLSVTAETGADARFLRRPLIGLSLFPINDGYAAAAQLPFDKAMHVTVIFEGTPAEKAGLLPGDYLVAIDGESMSSFGDYLGFLGRHKAGDSVTVSYYRDGQMHTTDLTFDARKAEIYPETREALYEKVNERVTRIEADLEALIAGVPDEALTQVPAPGEWSANETLAHMVWAERWYQQVLWLLISYGEAIPWGVNNRFQLDGILATHTTGAVLMAELRRTLREQVEMIRSIPDDTLAVKPLFHQIAGVLSYTGEHCRRHYTQITSAVEHRRAVRAD